MSEAECMTRLASLLASKPELAQELLSHPSFQPVIASLPRAAPSDPETSPD